MYYFTASLHTWAYTLCPATLCPATLCPATVHTIIDTAVVGIYVSQTVAMESKSTSYHDLIVHTLRHN